MINYEMKLNELQNYYNLYKSNQINRSYYYNKLNQIMREINNVKISSCEQMFEALMNNNNIMFIAELSNFDLVNYNNNLLRLDFVLISYYDDSKIIAGYEIDGPDHYKKNDNIKDKYFKEHNVPLIRLTQNDLLFNRLQILDQAKKLYYSTNINNYFTFKFHQ